MSTGGCGACLEERALGPAICHGKFGGNRLLWFDVGGNKPLDIPHRHLDALGA